MANLFPARKLTPQQWQAFGNSRKRNRSASLQVDKSARANGSIIFSANSAQTITLGGTVVTFGTSFSLGVDLAHTLQNLLTFLNASVNSNITQATYAVSASGLGITAKAPGTEAMTLAASVGTVSHSTLQLPLTRQRPVL